MIFLILPVPESLWPFYMVSGISRFSNREISMPRLLIIASLLCLAACDTPQADGPVAATPHGAQSSADKYCQQYGMHAKYIATTKDKKLSYDCVQ